MAEVDTIKTGMKTRIAAVLGSTYNELDHSIDVEKNTFKGNSLRFGVLSGPVIQNELAGVLKSFTVDQTYVVKLTDTFSTASTNDTDRTDTLDDLTENMLLIYKDFINTRAGAPSIVIQVLDLSIEDPEIIDKGNVAVITMTLTIKYRVNL